MRRSLWQSYKLGVFAGVFLVGLALAAAKPQVGQQGVGPLSPRQEQATFRLPKGFRIELVAAEPNVIDPVAMAFNEDGRIFVAEMRGYPNDGVGHGTITSGRIQLLEDRDGDGFYETSTLFAEGLRFPNGVMPWQGGLLVTNAPELIYLEDTDGDGKADRKRTLYTGFDLDNIQQMVNSLQWGMDNWVHGVAGSKGGTIRSAEKPDTPAVTLRGRGIRFHPETPGSLEPTSGGGQYGLAPDLWGCWFTATNSQHLRHIVLPDHYLRRNPLLPVSAVTLDIPDHGAACKVFRLSSFEAWRVERTTRRKDSAEAARFPSTELVPGGYITSACSPIIYLADAFPADYRGNAFVCDPANNLIHRDALAPKGATFTARRCDQDCEFLASTDNWFRPVWLSIGPEGALYILDFYREVIETPLSLPDDIKKRLNLESRGRGRIWRIAAEREGTKDREKSLRKPGLSKAPTRDLVEHLAEANIWWRLTAQRLLIERQDRAAVKPLEALAGSPRSAVGRAHALWTLHGLKALSDERIEQALKDAEAGVREQALRLAEERLAGSERLRAAALALADDLSPRVRFQFAFTAGTVDTKEMTAALARVARRDAADPWTQTAVLSSVGKNAPALLEALLGDQQFAGTTTPGALQLLTRLAALIGAGADDAGLARALGLLGSTGQEVAPWQVALLDGLGQGLQNSAQPLARLWEQPPPVLQAAVARARLLFAQAAATARDEKRSPQERVAAIRLLGRGPFALVEKAAPELLTPQTPSDLQLAAIRALAAHAQPRVAEMLLASWSAYSPAVRREVQETLFARRDRLPALLDALEHKKVQANHIDPVRLDQLRKHSDARLRERAQKLLTGLVVADRQKVVEAYRSVLERKADPVQGKAVFKKNCATCHRLENEGVEVGADLLATLPNKSREQLLIDILDPSREVDPRYLNYIVTTKPGQTLTGLIAAETASSITLRRGEKAEDTLLRSQIDEIQTTSKSLMPEGLEMQLSQQDVADVIAYLQAVAVPK